jgi:hypothetical protein
VGRVVVPRVVGVGLEGVVVAMGIVVVAVTATHAMIPIVT